MTISVPLVVFMLDSLRLALPLHAVDGVVPAVALTPLPGSPAAVAGAFNLHGEVVPVMDLRPRFLLRPRELGLDAHFLLVRSRGRLLALLVDEVQDVAEFDEGSVVSAGRISEGLDAIQGVVRLQDGLLLVNDPDRFLAAHESSKLAHALEEAFPGEP
jgi:purine-binding chemotaxis protein CheW